MAPPARTRPMKASLTSTSISMESMSTIVQMPVRVKPPPAETGEIISPGWALRSMTTPPNGARILCLSSTAALRCTSSRAVCEFACGLEQLGAKNAEPCFGLGQVGLAGEALLRQVADAVQNALRVTQVGRNGGCGGLGGGGPRARQVEVGFRQYAVQPRDDLAALHHSSLVDEELDNLAGDLRRDRRLAPRHDVPGGAEVARRARLLRRCRGFDGARSVRVSTTTARCSACPPAQSCGRKYQRPATSTATATAPDATSLGHRALRGGDGCGLPPVDRQRSQQFSPVVAHMALMALVQMVALRSRDFMWPN